MRRNVKIAVLGLFIVLWAGFNTPAFGLTADDLKKQIADLKFPPRQILIEIDPGQTKSAGRLIKKFLPKYSWKIKKDLSGQKRLLIISTI